MALIFLLFMAINQESFVIECHALFCHNCDTNTIYIYPKTHFQKAVSGVKNILRWFEQNESDIKLNFVLNSSAVMQHIL